MAATDIAPTRIEAARSIALRFINGLPASDRVAVVSFGDQVHLLVPPTFDRQRAIAGLPSAVVPLSGTRIGDGIDEATSVVIETVGKGYPGDPQKPGAVVLFSDGAQTSGGPTPQQAANTAYIDGIPINTVALGTSKGVVTQPARVDGFNTQVQLPVPVFPQGLATTSQLSSGIALAVGSPAQEASAARVLANVGRNLASTTLPGQRIRELSTDAAGIALALIVAAVLLSAFWFGRYV
jgi:Ca-activated chloride channel family protein